jgi:hypothetical protein
MITEPRNVAGIDDARRSKLGPPQRLLSRMKTHWALSSLMVLLQRDQGNRDFELRLQHECTIPAKE